jgi:hypothetical protein
MTDAHGVNMARVFQIDEPAGAIAPRSGGVKLNAADFDLIGEQFVSAFALRSTMIAPPAAVASGRCRP